MRARQQRRHVGDMTREPHDLAQPQIRDALLEDRPHRPLARADHHQLRYGEPHARHRLVKLDVSVAWSTRASARLDPGPRVQIALARTSRAEGTPIRFAHLPCEWTMRVPSRAAAAAIRVTSEVPGGQDTCSTSTR